MWFLTLLVHVWLSASLLLPVMLIILWAVRKWNWFNGRKILWLSIWGALGVVKMAMIGVFMGANGYYDFGPFFGPQYWTIYFFGVLLRSESWRTDWLFGTLVAAITEAALGCGLAAFCWWFSLRISNRNQSRGGFVVAERFAIGLLTSFCIFGIANNLNIWRPDMCSDCFAPHGFPFAFFHEGGFAGGAGWIWRGVQWDVGIMLAAGIVLGGVWSGLARAFKPTREAT